MIYVVIALATLLAIFAFCENQYHSKNNKKERHPDFEPLKLNLKNKKKDNHEK